MGGKSQTDDAALPWVALGVWRWKCSRIGAVKRQALTPPTPLNERRSMAFVLDAMIKGRKSRSLNSVVDYLRECQAADMDASITRVWMACCWRDGGSSRGCRRFRKLGLCLVRMRGQVTRGAPSLPLYEANLFQSLRSLPRLLRREYPNILSRSTVRLSNHALATRP